MRVLIVVLAAVLLPATLGAEPLSSAQRKAIDDRALDTPPEPVRATTQREAAGVVAWLANTALLDARDERDRLDDLHRRITRDHESLPNPSLVSETSRRLNATLSRELRPRGGSFEVVVLDSPDDGAFSRGGRRIYVTRGLIERRSGDEPRLAFVLARQIGHSVLGHADRDARVERLGDVATRDARTMLGAVAGTTASVGVNAWLPGAVEPNDDRDADLFALHLCRNAGYDLEHVLDELRRPLLDGVDDGPSMVPGMRRLARLRREIDGTFESERFGLFRHDDDSGTWTRATDRSVRGPVVLFVHGMESGPDVWGPLRETLAESRGDTTFLAYVHPNDGSLWAAGRSLAKEVDRVVVEPDRIDFVAHSAGGLVTRVYTDREGRAFRRAVLLGTPHGGSDLAELRVWIEATRFAGNLRLGYPAALRETLLDGEGQMTIDLQPGSPFLTYLHEAEVPEDVRRRFTNVRGRRWGRTAGVGARAGWIAARRLLRDRISDTTARPALRDLALARLDELKSPAEITAGDLAVAASRCRLPGATEVELRLDHLALVRDPLALEAVRSALAEP